MANAAKVAPAGELSAERVHVHRADHPVVARIAAGGTANTEPTPSMPSSPSGWGRSVDDRGLKLVSAVWGSILMTALTDLAADTGTGRS